MVGGVLGPSWPPRRRCHLPSPLRTASTESTWCRPRLRQCSTTAGSARRGPTSTACIAAASDPLPSPASTTAGVARRGATGTTPLAGRRTCVRAPLLLAADSWLPEWHSSLPPVCVSASAAATAPASPPAQPCSRSSSAGDSSAVAVRHTQPARMLACSTEGASASAVCSCSRSSPGRQSGVVSNSCGRAGGGRGTGTVSTRDAGAGTVGLGVRHVLSPVLPPQHRAGQPSAACLEGKLDQPVLVGMTPGRQGVACCRAAACAGAAEVRAGQGCLGRGGVWQAAARAAAAAAVAGGGAQSRRRPLRGQAPVGACQRGLLGYAVGAGAAHSALVRWRLYCNGRHVCQLHAGGGGAQAVVVCRPGSPCGQGVVRGGGRRGRRSGGGTCRQRPPHPAAHPPGPQDAAVAAGPGQWGAGSLCAPPPAHIPPPQGAPAAARWPPARRHTSAPLRRPLPAAPCTAAACPPHPSTAAAAAAARRWDWRSAAAVAEAAAAGREGSAAARWAHQTAALPARARRAAGAPSRPAGPQQQRQPQGVAAAAPMRRPGYCCRRCRAAGGHPPGCRATARCPRAA